MKPNDVPQDILVRKLASVQRIADLQPIDGADKIELAIINGWQAVVAKEVGHQVGDLVVYCEIDSWLPHELAPFLSKGKEPREYNGIKGERLRTIKLRGQLSQGLILPLSVVPAPAGTAEETYREGDDVTLALGITKWEKPIPAQLQGKMRGNFPADIRKTDQERVQNLRQDQLQDELTELYEATIKLDGSSMTIWVRPDSWGVCSRNIDLDLDQEGNTFVDVAKRLMTPERLALIRATAGGVAIQGELVGPNIQGNRWGFKEHEFHVFDVWRIDQQCYMSVVSRLSFVVEQLRLSHVPLLSIMPLLCTADSAADLLDLADGLNAPGHPPVEGLVFKRIDGQFSFKAISNRYLLAED